MYTRIYSDTRAVAKSTTRTAGKVLQIEGKK